VAVATLLLCLAVPALSLSQEKPRPAAPSPDNLFGGFYLVLLTADNKPGPPVEGVTPAVLKALKDVQQFLPYKTYRLVDTILVRGSFGGDTRISAPDGDYFNVSIKTTFFGERRGRIDFQLLSRFTSSTEQSSQPILRSTFDITLGETVVAGTSRLAGDASALVAVLTALPESALR
jgi:hypothetical protein